MAERLDLEMVVLDLNDKARVRNTLNEVDLVLNTAGPFVHTAPALVSACLETGTSYLDVSGEVTVFEHILTLEQQALENEIAIIPGVGFNVVASDCLARYVSEKIENPTHLEIATDWIMNGTSPGSQKTMIENFPMGTLARRGGQLARINVRDGRKQRFLNGERTVLPVTLGDLTAAYRSTGIPNITMYTAFPERTASFYSLTEPILRRIYGVAFFRRMASKWITNKRLANQGLTNQRLAITSGSENHQQREEPAQVWALARNDDGIEYQAWMETVDSYQFTARAAVRSVEKLFSDHQVGVLTPALAFGADFALEIPGTMRVDHLES
jgi:short subunit dehydrogenase-like uncharacterized protein